MTGVSRRAPRTLFAAVALVVALTVIVVFVIFQAIFNRSSTFSGTLSPGSASCPPRSEQPTEMSTPRPGQPLLPPDPTVALLCIYKSSPNELVRTFTLSEATGLVDFLNERPETAEIACPMGDDAATAEPGFLVVVGYPEGFAVVRPTGCGVLESMGAVRYEAGRDLFAFWGVTPQDAWPQDVDR